MIKLYQRCDKKEDRFKSQDIQDKAKYKELEARIKTLEEEKKRKRRKLKKI